MPLFQYTATDSQNQIIKETIIAANIAEAKKVLNDQGYKIKTIKEIQKKESLFSHFSGGLPVLERSTLFRYLATMVNAGLSLPESLGIYAQDSHITGLKHILLDAQQQLQQGKTLSSALSQYPKSFDRTTISIIQAGEISGTLTQALNYLAKQLYSEYQLKQKVKSAMMYPLIIIFAMGGVGLILIFFVLPKIAPIFLQMNLTLPLFSRLILKGGLFISQHAFLVMSLFFFFIASLGFALTKKAGRQATLKILSLLPAIKKLLDELDLARFCRTLSTLLSSGVPISDSLFIVMESLSQVKYQKLATNFQKEIQKGRSLSEIMREENKLFPNMVIRMIATGEKTGSVDTMLAELADHYEKEIDSALSNFTSILEPVLLLLVGIGVGVMVLAVIAPIYSLVGGIESATPGR